MMLTMIASIIAPVSAEFRQRKARAFYARKIKIVTHHSLVHRFNEPREPVNNKEEIHVKQ